MSFYQLISNTMENTLGVSLTAFRPELVLCGLIVVLLFLRMLVPRWKMGPFWVTTLGAVVAFWLLAPWSFLSQEAPGKTEIFTGMLVEDGLSVFLRAILLGFTVLFALFTQISGIPDREDATEFFTLVLGAVLGMCLMVSANHMLIVFLGMEMASVPSYVLAGILRGRRVGSEAALKYAVYGAAAAGVMLYGISLLCGTLGTGHLPTMGTLLADMIQHNNGAAFEARQMVLTLGGLMLVVGVAFKLSAVPFHFWAPDVFEGATAEVAAMLSIVSKAAALGLLLRLVIGFGYVPDVAGLEALEPVRHFIVVLVGTLAVVTCTFGNLAAYGQNNLKRLFAYSTIAHAGYMMMPVAAVVAMMGDVNSVTETNNAVSALLFYVTIYLFMNLGAFAVIAFVRNVAGDEEIGTLGGLVRHSTGLTVVFSITLFSLIGLPPFAGFVAKFAAFAAVWDAGLFWLVVIGVLNTALSLFYYLRIVKTMTLEEPAVARPPVIIPLWSPQGLFCLAVMLPLLVWGIWGDGLYTWAEAAAKMLFR